MKKILFLLLTIISFSINAQVYNSRDYKYSNQMNIGKGGNTMVSTDSCAMLELGSEGINRALLLPRGDTAGVPTAKRGAIFYNLADSSVYFRTRNKWNKLSTGSGGGGSYTSDNGITLTSSNFSLGGALTKNTTVYGLYSLMFGSLNKYSVYADTIFYGLGSNRFIHTTSLPGGGHLANSNLFLGRSAGESVASTDSAIACTGIGAEALYSLHSATNAAGSSNTAVGYKAGRPMRYGVRNVILGTVAMGDCRVGTLARPLTGNIAIGHHAYRQGASDYNIAIGPSAMENANDDFTDIIGIGQYAMMEDSASFNIGIGFQAGRYTKNGGKNVFLGWNSGTNGVASEKNVYVGYYTGFNVLGVGANVAIGAGAMQGGAGATGNTNVVIGNNSFNSATSGSRNVFIGNNSAANGVVNVTTGSNNIVIGNASTTTADGASNELNIGKALYGANIYTTNPRFALGKVAGTNSTFDMGGCSLPVILPKSSSIPSVGLETAMIYYNQNTNNIDLYDGSWGAIQRKQPFNVVTDAGGLSWNSTITPQVELDATSNAITQTIPSHSTDYTGWVVEFTIVGAASNAVTFNIPSTAMLNGVTGATTFTPSNGNVVRVRNDGSRWVITNK